jgi:hypothetical protein
MVTLIFSVNQLDYKNLVKKKLDYKKKKKLRVLDILVILITI